jgi:predicted ATPase
MIRTLRFHNYRVLRDAELHLQPFTLLVGPNGSGKSTVMHALKTLRVLAKGVETGRNEMYAQALLSHFAESRNARISINITWDGGSKETTVKAETINLTFRLSEIVVAVPGMTHFLQNLRVYALNEHAIISAVTLEPLMELQEDGAGLAGVLDRMRDQTPEAFEALNEEIGSLLPEFDRILFETPAPGRRAFMLRTREGHHAIKASDLSQGTVLALAILTLAHLSDPPSMVCLEEPDRGIHPRLYREIQDALYRLAYPESFGLKRKPVQVLVTTHSPYLLDLHRDHPEEVVIAQKNGTSASFQRLIDREDIQDLLSEASLGELWYSGVLGGVPVAP